MDQQVSTRSPKRGSKSSQSTEKSTKTYKSAPEELMRFEKAGQPQLSLGENHSCWLSPEGEVNCMGLEEKVPEHYRPQTLASGRAHACMIDVGGLLCWGNNDWGQSSPPVWPEAQMLAAGSVLSCAASKTEVKCWGTNNPIAADVKFTSISGLVVGTANVCVIDEGRVRCFGDDNYRILSDLPPLSKVLKIGLASHHICALDEIQGLKCWGNDDDGQTNLSGKTYRDFAVGTSHSCGLENSQIHCRGAQTSQMLDPPELKANEQVQSFSLGSTHGCIMLMNGSIRCWGNDKNQRFPPNRGI